MFIVDILSLDSCISMGFARHRDKKVYYVLKAIGLIDRMAIWMLRRLGWNFVQLDYDLGPTGSNRPYVDLQTELFVLTETIVAPAITQEVGRWGCFSDYEKKHLVSYLTFRERHDLHQRIELLKIIDLMKNDIGFPDLVFLYRSRWEDVVTKKYLSRGYRARFYRMWSRPRLASRQNYYHANIVQGVVYERGYWGIATALWRIVRDLVLSASAGIQRYFVSAVPISLARFDICAIIAGYKRTKWFNDLLWKAELCRRGQNLGVLAILYGPLDAATREAYDGLVDRWITMGWTKPSSSLCSAMHWLWPMFPVVLIRNIARFLRSTVQHPVPADHIARVLSILLDASKMEVLFRITGARIFWTTIGLSDLQSVGGILAMRRLRGVSLGTTWSSCMMPLIALPLYNTDVFFIWGPRHAQLFTKSISLSKLIAGYPGDAGINHYMVKAERLRAELKRRYPNKILICLYDEFFSRDDGYSYYEMIKSVNELVGWVIAHPNTVLIIKPKIMSFPNLYPRSTRELFTRLEEHGRLICERELADLAPGFAADIVAGVGLSTLPCLMGTYGKKVISFDCNRYNERWPIGTDNITYIAQSDEVVKKLDHWFENIGMQNIDKIEIRPNPNRLDSYVDGRSAERIGGYISNLIEDMDRGYNSDEAIANANRMFSELWGSDKVIEADRGHNEFAQKS